MALKEFSRVSHGHCGWERRAPLGDALVESIGEFVTLAGQHSYGSLRRRVAGASGGGYLEDTEEVLI